MVVLYPQSKFKMKNFLNRKKIVLINCHKSNSGNLIQNLNNYGAKVIQTSISKNKILSGKNKEEKKIYTYYDFSSLISNFPKDLKFQKIDVFIFFLEDNNLLKNISSTSNNYNILINEIISMSDKIIKHLKKNNHSKIIFVLLPYSCIINEKNKILLETLNSAFEGYCKSIAKSLATDKILVNSISPGFVVNRRIKKLKNKKNNSFEKNIPLKRLAKLDEIESLLLFLSSEYNTYITGQKIDVDGGFNSI